MASSTSLRIEEQVHAPQTRRPEPVHAPKRPWLKWTALVLVLGLAIAGAVTLARRARQVAPAGPAAPAAYAPVTRGPLVRTLRLGGVVAAVHFAGVSAPSLRGAGPGGSQLSVVRIASAGARVKKGDLLAEFERQAQRNNFEDRQAEYISLTDQIAKRRAELDIERGQRQTEILKARTDVEGARLENKRNEVSSKIDAEKNEQALKEAEATLKMLEQTQELRLAAAAAEIKVLEIRRERERLQMENARMNFERLVVQASIAGMVVLTPIWKGNQMGTVQEGDQVRPGVVFLQVVDSTAMVVKARVNQLDAALLRPGLPGVVRLDAYPALSFPGKVESISTLAQAPGWWTKYVKTFPVVFTVEGSDPRLIPDISASFDAELERVPDALLVPRGAVVRQAASQASQAGSPAGVQVGRPARSSAAGLVWVKQGDRIQPRAVTLGPNSDSHWAITSGLKEGEMVALYPPATEAKHPVKQESGKNPRPASGAGSKPETKTDSKQAEKPGAKPDSGSETKPRAKSGAKQSLRPDA